MDCNNCDHQLMEDVKARVTKRIAPFMCDKDGNKLFYVDSFGFQGQLPGECRECYDRYVEEQNKATEGMYD